MQRLKEETDKARMLAEELRLERAMYGAMRAEKQWVEARLA